MATLYMDPADTREFFSDWANYLAPGETIDSATVTSLDGVIAVVSHRIVGSRVYFQVSAGSLASRLSWVQIDITTAGGPVVNIWRAKKAIFLKARIAA